MLDLKHLLRLLAPYLIHTTIPKGRTVCPTQLELLDDQTELEADRVYLGEISSLPVLKKALPKPEGTVLIAVARKGSQPAALPEGWVQIFVSCPLPRLYNTVAQAVRESRMEWDQEHLTPTVRIFRRFWEDVMERRIINRTEIRDALSKMPYPVYHFLRVMVITFKSDNIHVPYDYLLERLRVFFPETNMTLYRKDIILLYSHPERDFRPSLGGAEQVEKLSALLQQYDGYLMISNGTHHAEALASMYLLSKQTLDLAYLLRNDKEERVLFTEDYIIYSVIDLCVQRFLQTEQNEDILYLTHPAIPLLTRYDREHNTDLRDVLFYYLLNGCNMVHTASTLYMHRNTVNNKVNQIKKLTHLELEDPRLRQRLLFSCQIMRYYELVLQKEMQ